MLPILMPLLLRWADKVEHLTQLISGDFVGERRRILFIRIPSESVAGEWCADTSCFIGCKTDSQVVVPAPLSEALTRLAGACAIQWMGTYGAHGMSAPKAPHLIRWGEQRTFSPRTVATFAWSGQAFVHTEPQLLDALMPGGGLSSNAQVLKNVFQLWKREGLFVFLGKSLSLRLPDCMSGLQEHRDRLECDATSRDNLLQHFRGDGEEGRFRRHDVEALAVRSRVELGRFLGGAEPAEGGLPPPLVLTVTNGVAAVDPAVAAGSGATGGSPASTASPSDAVSGVASGGTASTADFAMHSATGRVIPPKGDALNLQVSSCASPEPMRAPSPRCACSPTPCASSAVLSPRHLALLDPFPAGRSA